MPAIVVFWGQEVPGWRMSGHGSKAYVRRYHRRRHQHQQPPHPAYIHCFFRHSLADNVDYCVIIDESAAVATTVPGRQLHQPDRARSFNRAAAEGATRGRSTFH